MQFNSNYPIIWMLVILPMNRSFRNLKSLQQYSQGKQKTSLMQIYLNKNILLIKSFTNKISYSIANQHIMSLKLSTESLLFQSLSIQSFNQNIHPEKGFAYVRSRERSNERLIGKSQIFAGSRIKLMPDSYISAKDSLMLGEELSRKSSQRKNQIGFPIHVQAIKIDVMKYLQNTQQDDEKRDDQALSSHSIKMDNKISVERTKKQSNNHLGFNIPQNKKKKSLKKSNAYKNFANRFRIYFNKFENVEDLFQQDEQMRKLHHKNVSDNLNKKIKYEKRAQKWENMESMLSHKKFSHIIIQACKRYLQIYPKQILQSTKMQDAEENKKILKDIEQIIKKKQANFRQ